MLHVYVDADACPVKAEAERVAESPLSEADQAYLRQLLAAGSKAELARRAGVSRAAVTQRVQRIRRRVAELAPRERSSHEVWLHPPWLPSTTRSWTSVRPSITSPAPASTPRIFSMFRRTRTWGRPVVAESWCT